MKTAILLVDGVKQIMFTKKMLAKAQPRTLEEAMVIIRALQQRLQLRTSPKAKSGLWGVIHHPKLKRKPWKAYIRHHGMFLSLGYFRTKEEAAAEYNKAAKKYVGSGARLNKLTPASLNPV